jgi:hypothetical protein
MVFWVVTPCSMVFWVVTPCSIHMDANVSVKDAASIFRAEVSRVSRQPSYSLDRSLSVLPLRWV